MKKLLIGLLALSSISAFASEACGQKGTIEEHIIDCNETRDGNFWYSTRRNFEIHVVARDTNGNEVILSADGQNVLISELSIKKMPLIRRKKEIASKMVRV